MRTALLLLLALAASGTAAAATVWKWVDEKGVTHYSDTPVPGATRVEISTGNVSQSRSYESSSTAASSTPSAAQGDFYRTFEIWRPENDQTFVNTAGQVNVEIRVEPALQAGHSLNLYLDGRLVDGYSGSTSHVLQGVSRGSHSLVATINEQRGTRVRETGPITFTVRQESIANPPVGPALRPPPPKPQPRTGASNKVLTSQPSYGALNGSRPAINPATNLPVVKTEPKPKKP